MFSLVLTLQTKKLVFVSSQLFQTKSSIVSRTAALDHSRFG
jgi:hypothetical protein